MWQGHLIHPALPQTFPSSQQPARRMHTPTPNGFEGFLQECLDLPYRKVSRSVGVIHGPSLVRHNDWAVACCRGSSTTASRRCYVDPGINA
jgi:hypothetical protein